MINSRNERLLLGINLFIAAGLRMGWPNLTEFKSDEAHLYSLALDMAEGLQFPLRGIGSSVGFPNFPLSAWLYAVPTFFWKHPYSATLFTGLLSTLSILGCWWIVRRYWGAQAALATAFMYAVSPWAIIYSRKIWAQNLIPVFVIGWAASGMLTFVEGRRRSVAVHMICLAIVLQLHLSGAALLPVTALGLVLYRRKVDWRWLAAGVVTGVLLGTPLLLHLVSKDLAILSDLTASIPGSAQISASFYFTWILSTGKAIHSLAGTSAFRDYLQTVPDITWVMWLWTSLMAIGCWGLVSGRHEKTGRGPYLEDSRAASTMILTWLLGPSLFFFFWRLTPVFPHYLITTFPAQFIVGGVGAATIMQQARRRPVSVAIWVALVLGGGLQVWVLAGLLHFVAQTSTPGGFGTPLGMHLAAAEKAAALVEKGQAREVLLVGDGSNPAIHEFPAIYDSLMRNVPHRFVNGTTSALRPVAPAAVLLDVGTFNARRIYHGWGVKSDIVPLRSDEGELTILYMPQRSEDLTPRVLFSDPRQLANGVTLLGYTPITGDMLRWEIYWQTGETVAANYHFFNHLIDQEGSRVGQADAPAFTASQWRVGDHVVSFFSTDQTSGGQLESLRLGMYSYPAVVNSPLIDDNGNPVSDAMMVTWISAESLNNGSE